MENAVWFDVCDNLVKEKENGEIEHLPAPYSIDYFYIENNRADWKQHSTLKAAVKDAVQKIKRSSKSAFSIQACVSWENSFAGTKTVCRVSFEGGEWKLKKSLWLREYKNVSMTREEVASIRADESFPASWFPARRITKSAELEQTLLESFNVSKVVYKKGCSADKRERFLEKLLAQCGQIASFVDIFALPPLRVSAYAIKKYAGLYREYEKEVVIHPDSPDSFSHEFGHHVEHSAWREFRKRWYQEHPDGGLETPEGEWGGEFAKRHTALIKSLEETESMHAFCRRYAYLLDENKNVLPKFRKSRAEWMYLYWTSSNEIFARAFSDYTRFMIGGERERRSSDDFSFEEIAERKELLEAFLDAAGVLKKMKEPN